MVITVVITIAPESPARIRAFDYAHGTLGQEFEKGSVGCLIPPTSWCPGL